MSKASVSLNAIETELLQNDEFRQEYERLRPRYELIAQLIRARNDQHITQAEMASRMGTQKSNISRLESGTYNPSLDFLIRAAGSLGKRLEISLQ